MRFNIIIYKLQWFTGVGHKKGEAKYNKCKKRKNKYKIYANVVKKKSGRTDIVIPALSKESSGILLLPVSVRPSVRPKEKFVT